MIGTLLGLVALSQATPLDDYVNKKDGTFAWRDTGVAYETALLNRAHILNVTSQKWLPETNATGPDGSLWTHQLGVIVPRNWRVKNKAVLYITGNCNGNPHPPGRTDQDIALVDTMADLAGSITVALFQVPNCPIVFSSDPEKRHRSEDALIAWAWRQYLLGESAEWLPRLPMAKAAFKAMEAVQMFAESSLGVTLEGWVVAGASKRGWTTWDTGYARYTNCEKACPNILAIAPMVPIVPDLHPAVHHMWKSYGGWTFAFNDYYAANITAFLDTPRFQDMLQIVDPMGNLDRLADIPKHIVVSSDDEFMMFEWTQMWWDAMPGEKHLTIAHNSEHSLITGIPEVITTLACTFRSIFAGQKVRPTLSPVVDLTAGTITVTVPPPSPQPLRVRVWTAETHSKKLRDFRWIRLANNQTGRCIPPAEVPIPPQFGGGNCLVPIVWRSTLLNATGDRWVYQAVAPSDGWAGAYVEADFASDTGIDTTFQLTSPGLVWPNTFPFPDCSGMACKGTLL